MDVSKPLPAALSIYECLRLLLLVAFLFIVSPLENGISSGIGAFFPFMVYISSNALFPLMAIFLWLRPDEYRSYITLYMAGKIIAVVSFYVWVIFSSREGLTGAENIARSIALLGGSILINMADILSVWGAWTLKKKYRKADSGGL